MSYFSPRREVRLKAEQKEKGTGKAVVIAAAIVTFAGSIFIGRWVGLKLLESRTAIKSPASAEGYQAPMGQPPGSQSYAEPPRQNISAPPLIIPPPVVEPKTATENSDNGSGQPSDQMEPAQKVEPAKPITLLPKEKSSRNQEAPGSKNVIYKVQTGLFSTIDNAKELVESLEKQGYVATFESISRPDGSYYRVWVGPYDNRAQAESAATGLNGNGYQAFVVEESAK